MNTKKIISSLLSIAAATALLTGCGGDAPTATVTPASGESNNSGVVTITGNDQMKFNLTEFTVKPGSEVTVVFKNIGRMPKETMGHNLVILVKGTDTTAFANASMRHPTNEYVAPELKDSVIAFTKVLGPGESETLTFTAPSETGDYPFVCSFPGHTPAGMKGIMKVQ